MTREEKNAWQREYRKRRGPISTKAYEKTPSGFLMRAYRNMKSRVTGVQHLKAHLYLGKELLSKEDFYAWADSVEFRRMFNAWLASGYDRRLAPSVDRIDPKRGYTTDNMRWLTHSQNSSLGAQTRKSAEKKVIYRLVGVKHA